LLNALEPKHAVTIKETNTESNENVQTTTTTMYPLIEDDDNI